MSRTITNPANGSALNSEIIRTELQTLEDEIALKEDKVTGKGLSTNDYTTAEKSKLAGIEASADVTDAGNVGSSVHGSSAKTTMADTDKIAIIDTEASNVLKTLSWAYVKSILKTYFDTIYTTASAIATAVSNHAALLNVHGLNITAGKTLTVTDNTSISGTHSGTSSGTNTGDQTLPVKAAGSDITTGTDDAKFLTAKALADAAVGKIGAAWTSFVPNYSNLTEGSGTNVGAYTQIGKTVHFYAKFTFAADSSVSGLITLTLPVTAKRSGIGQIGKVLYFDNGTETWQGHINQNGELIVDTISGTKINRTVTSATVPFTWTTNDYIEITGTYEAA